MITQVRKRDGRVVEFDQKKIIDAVWKAASAVGGTDISLAEKISNQVTAVLEVFFKGPENIPTVEQVQDLVEKILIEGGHAKTAKAYILYRYERKNIRTGQEDILNGRTTKLPFSMNALRVLAGRYLQHDEENKVIESPEDMFDRVADALASVDRDYGKSEDELAQLKQKFYDIMSKFEFTPAGRTLTNAGGKTRLVANCIVLHFDDSMDSIFGTLHEAALLQQAGSGLGFAWHRLRPAGTFTHRTQGMASGPIPFLRAYNEAFGVIKQQGRHGANMGVMRVDHPDILEFIECKWKEGELVNFNISVALTDEFMEQVRDQSKEPWLCEWKGKKMKPRRVIRNGRGAFVEAIEETITASELMDRIIDFAWRNGEPGVLFPDAANRANPVPELGRLEATNPCGEQWLHDGDVCNLGSINLSKFVKNGEIDERHLREVTELAVHMLDNVIDLSDFPVAKVNKTFRNNRRIGLGIMGFADMLYQMRAPYDSPEGRAIGNRVMKLINDAAHDYSERLAAEKGLFPNWEISIFGPKGTNRKQRNANLTSIAPTGSISMVFDCSSGIEPFFALTYHKTVMGGQRLLYINPYLEEELTRLNLNRDDIIKEIERMGSIQHIEEIPLESRRIFVTAMDISADAHMEMQAAFQPHVDNSISKTINFTYNATRNDVRAGYIHAWELGLKGCTVYRDGSRQEQVLNLNKEPEKQTADASAPPSLKTVATVTAAVAKEEASANAQEVDLPPIMGNASARAHKPLNARSGATKNELMRDRVCPECEQALQVAEGCVLCLSCGFSVCSV